VATKLGVEGIPQVLRRNARILAKVKSQVQRELSWAAECTANQARADVPVDTGYLRAQIRAERIGDLHWVVATGEPGYAAAVEFGTKPHWPNMRVLKRWAKRKLGDERLAYPVAKAIAQRGTPEHPYLSPAFERYRRQLRVQLEQIATEVSGR